MSHWVPTDRVRGGFTPVSSTQDKEYAEFSIFATTKLTPGSYSSPTSLVQPSLTSLRALPPPSDPVLLQPTPPPVIPTTGTTTTTSGSTTDVVRTDLAGGGFTTTTTTTNTTDTSTTFFNGVVDVSIIPYMRRLDIDFVAMGLRPNRKHLFFFDETNVTQHISQSNLVVLDDTTDRVLDPDIPPPFVDPAFPHDEIIDLTVDTFPDSIVPNTANGFATSGNMPLWERRDRLRGRRRARVARRRRFRNPDRTRGNVILQVLGQQDLLRPGDTIRTTESGQTGRVIDFVSRQGHVIRFMDSDDINEAHLRANNIILGNLFRVMPNNWWGTDGSNVLTLISHHMIERNDDLPWDGRFGWRGRSRRILGFDNVTGRIELEPTDDDVTNDIPFFTQEPTAQERRTDGVWVTGPLHVAIAQYDPVITASTGYVSQAFFTDSEGTFSGTFHCPGGVFLTGQKVFKMIDELNGIDINATSRASYVFRSSGLAQITQDVVSTNRDVSVSVVSTTVPPPPPPFTGDGGGDPGVTDGTWWPDTGGGDGDGGDGGDGDGDGDGDPIAQTFYVDPQSYPEGMFLSSVDLFFYNKDETTPVKLEIRPTINGYPDSNYIIPGSKVTLTPDEVKLIDGVSNLPNTQIESSKTKFRFGNPIYVPPGEFSFVVYTQSKEYEVWASELGQRVIGTNSYVSEQPYIGSLFKSQNASTWTPTQLEDLMFVLNKCRFVPSGSATFYNKGKEVSVPTDEIFVHTNQSILPTTSLNYDFADEGSNTFSNFQTDIVHVPSYDGRVTTPANADGYYKIRATMSTQNPDISPVIYHNDYTILLTQNYIDNADLNYANFIILNGGSGYDPNSNISLVFAGSGNGDAVAYAQANSTGIIDRVRLDEAGSGFVNDFTISLANTYTNADSVSSSNGSGAIIDVSTEIDSAGGTAICKYISRVVTLNQGFDSADLKVFLTAYKPLGTDIHVYYKVKNSNDAESFNSKPYFKMIEKETLNNYSRSTRDYIEFEFTPFGEDDPFKDITYSTGSATYATFDQFAIKIILVTNDTTRYPVLRDLRAIALPSNEVL